MALSERDKAIVNYTLICARKQFSAVVAELSRELGKILKDVETEEAFELFAEAVEELFKDETTN